MNYPGPLKPFAAAAGSKSPKIVLVGEAFGESEAVCRQPFVGTAGRELWRLLGEAIPTVAPKAHSRALEMHRYGNAWIGSRSEWLGEAQIAMTNVLAFRPPDNKIDQLCVPKGQLPSGYALPHIARAQYLHPDYLPELDRLEAELLAWQPNIVVALGNTACWALLRATNISSIRGTVTMGSLGRWTGKVLPTYHPAAVVRQWSWRPIVVADLMKAHRESASPDLIRPKCRVLIEPTIDEVMDMTDDILSAPPARMSIDIETRGGQISCIGFGLSRSLALVIPFIDFGKPDWSYWPHEAAEREAWNCVRRLCESPVPKVFQNGVYDLQYISRMGIMTRACQEDTMLLHHSHYPEMQKGLGFLGSVYTNHASWKLMRSISADTVKRDE